ncbi:MAG: hypothetical protein DRP06_01625 [Candidatus Aenigmatarchaeota archaeon]|nr:MAG: hypothetical protein DRP06_01625 [Candidatus Aenigmarchaeota archaeon]
MIDRREKVNSLEVMEIERIDKLLNNNLLNFLELIKKSNKNPEDINLKNRLRKTRQNRNKLKKKRRYIRQGKLKLNNKTLEWERTDICVDGEKK